MLWALNGSSHHKVYPLIEGVLGEFFRQHPDARCITTGDTIARLLEFEHPQVIPMADNWTLREALIAPKYVDLVVGPETMMTNAAGCFDTPKICLLSHSTKENLTKYWLSDHSLEPDQTIAPCYPCHQLHYSSVGSCPQGEVIDEITNTVIAKGPICAMGAINPERLLHQIEEVYQKWLNLN
jgi:ADP-heptose:LPS heptosyltransferase